MVNSIMIDEFYTDGGKVLLEEEVLSDKSMVYNILIYGNDNNDRIILRASSKEKAFELFDLMKECA